MDRFEMFNRFFIIVYIAIIVTSMFVCYYRFQDYGRLIQKDTVYVNVSDSSSIIQLDSLYNVIDSLEQINDDYFTELTIATIKLERIRDYNEVAKKGNNIKYLRGWINRVLNE